MKNVTTKLSLVISLFYLAILFTACQKDNVNQDNSSEPELTQSKSFTEGQLIDAPTLSGSNTDRGGGFNPPVYPYCSGPCKLIFVVSAFDPNVPHGGGGPPCKPTDIVIKGYSQPNGQGTLLFTQSMPVTGDWQEATIPSSAYIQYKFVSAILAESEPKCRFNFTVGNYGWNRSVVKRVNIPYDQWYPVITGRFAPKDPSTDGWFIQYDEYLCDSWCTWTMPIDFDPLSPEPGSFLGIFQCFFGSVPQFPNPADPRMIVDYALWTPEDQTLLIYPITDLPNAYYISKATSHYQPIQHDLSYYLRGVNGNGVGPFSWGIAPYGASTSGSDCNVLETK